LLPFLFCLVFLKRNSTKKKKVFFLYASLVAVLIITAYSLRYVLQDREDYFKVVRLYIVIEYCLLAYYFFLHVKNKFIGKLLLLSTPVFITFCIYDYTTEKLPGLPFVPFSVEYTIFLVLIIYYFFELMQEMVSEPIYQKAVFWVSVAFIINFSGNFFLFLYSTNSSSYNDEDFKRQYTIIYTTITVIKNVLLCISILINEKTESSLPTDRIDIDLDTVHPLNSKN
jgi:hypothetical protein